MINPIQRGLLANAIALHDFKKSPIDCKGLFYYAEEWFYQAGLTPTKIGISGEEGVKSGKKTILFESGKKRLEKFNFEGVKNIWIAALPDDVGTEMFDFIFSVNLYQELNGKRSVCFCWDDQIIKFAREYIENLAKDLYNFLEPAYGYSYQRLFNQGPSFYPFGVIAGLGYAGEEGREAKRIGKWGSEYAYEDGIYTTGLFRDIYPINFLSQPHFMHEIEGMPLKNWIESSPDHGELKQLTENLWSWWVPEDKIAAVRDRFMPTGLLLSY